VAGGVCGSECVHPRTRVGLTIRGYVLLEGGHNPFNVTRSADETGVGVDLVLKLVVMLKCLVG
jgi:hypothetical protein